VIARCERCGKASDFWHQDRIVINGKYKILDRVGVGGQGAVYKAHHFGFNVVRALKRLPSDWSHDVNRRERFQREARTAVDLDAAHCVKVFELESEDGTLVMVSEFAELGSLERHVPKGGMDISMALELARDICEGLTVIHRKRLIHRDIKPSNILLFPGDHRGGWARPIAKVADLGIAASLDTDYTRSSFRFVSDGYSAPEQDGLKGVELTFAADLFGFGMTLYYMLAGRGPYLPEEFRGGWPKIFWSRPPVSPIVFRPELAEIAGLEALVMKMIAAIPSERPQSAEEVARELDLLLAGMRQDGEGTPKDGSAVEPVAGAAIPNGGASNPAIPPASPGPTSPSGDTWRVGIERLLSQGRFPEARAYLANGAMAFPERTDLQELQDEIALQQTEAGCAPIVRILSLREAAFVAIQNGRLDEAKGYVDQLDEAMKTPPAGPAFDGLPDEPGERHGLRIGALKELGTRWDAYQRNQDSWKENPGVWLAHRQKVSDAQRSIEEGRFTEGRSFLASVPPDFDSRREGMLDEIEISEELSKGAFEAAAAVLSRGSFGPEKIAHYEAQVYQGRLGELEEELSEIELWVPLGHQARTLLNRGRIEESQKVLEARQQLGLHPEGTLEKLRAISWIQAQDADRLHEVQSRLERELEETAKAGPELGALGSWIRAKEQINRGETESGRKLLSELEKSAAVLLAIPAVRKRTDALLRGDAQASAEGSGKFEAVPVPARVPAQAQAQAQVPPVLAAKPEIRPDAKADTPPAKKAASVAPEASKASASKSKSPVGKGKETAPSTPTTPAAGKNYTLAIGLVVVLGLAGLLFAWISTSSSGGDGKTSSKAARIARIGAFDLNDLERKLASSEPGSFTIYFHSLQNGEPLDEREGQILEQMGQALAASRSVTSIKVMGGLAQAMASRLVQGGVASTRVLASPSSTVVALQVIRSASAEANLKPSDPPKDVPPKDNKKSRDKAAKDKAARDSAAQESQAILAIESKERSSGLASALDQAQKELKSLPNSNLINAKVNQLADSYAKGVVASVREKVRTGDYKGALETLQAGQRRVNTDEMQRLEKILEAELKRQGGAAPK